MSADAASAEARSSSRTSLSASSIASARPVSATARRYAAVVTQKPGGTGSPTEISSPRLAPFPPPRSRSFRRSVSSGTTSLRGGASNRLSTSGFSASSCSPRSYISVGSVLMGVASVPGSFSPQAAVYQRHTTANRAGLLILLPNLGVRLRAFENSSREVQEFMGRSNIRGADVLTSGFMQADLLLLAESEKPKQPGDDHAFAPQPRGVAPPLRREASAWRGSTIAPP